MRAAPQAHAAIRANGSARVEPRHSTPSDVAAMATTSAGVSGRLSQSAVAIPARKAAQSQISVIVWWSLYSHMMWCLTFLAYHNQQRNIAYQGIQRWREHQHQPGDVIDRGVGRDRLRPVSKPLAGSRAWSPATAMRGCYGWDAVRGSLQSPDMAAPETSGYKCHWRVSAVTSRRATRCSESPQEDLSWRLRYSHAHAPITARLLKPSKL